MIFFYKKETEKIELVARPGGDLAIVSDPTSSTTPTP